MPTDQVESVVLGVAAGSRVTSFDVASYRSTSKHTSRSERHMCVEEVAGDGTIGATLIAWKHYGMRRGRDAMGYEPSDYTPSTIAVETTATRFKVSVRHTYTGANTVADVAIFRATGVAP